MSEKTGTEPETGPAESETWKIINREEQLEAKKAELEEKLARLKKSGGGFSGTERLLRYEQMRHPGFSGSDSLRQRQVRQRWVRHPGFNEKITRRCRGRRKQRSQRKRSMHRRP